MKSLHSFSRSALAACALVAASTLTVGAAQAATSGTSITTPLSTPLAVVGGYDYNLTQTRGTFDPAWLSGTNYTSLYDITDMVLGGSLLTEAVAEVTFTLVGFESSANNAFTVGGQTLTNFTGFGTAGQASNLGASLSFSNVSAGVLSFGFLTDGVGKLKGNGHFSTGVLMADDHRSALITFNDRLGDRDYDDMVIRMSVATLAPVPEPEAAAMLLAGLGLVGAATRRRQRRGA